MDNTPAQTTDNAPRSLRHLSVYLATLVKGRLWLKVLIGMGLGLVVGTLLGPSVGLVEPETGTLIGNWLAFPGQLFLATIQMIVIPLVIASVVRGLAASDNLEQQVQTSVPYPIYKRCYQQAQVAMNTAKLKNQSKESTL